ncbi:gamma interferon inducible lysosomal thiol reductase [Cooperia oncophora]
MLSLLALALTVHLVHAVRTELPNRSHPLVLLERDLENLQCLFFRRNCSNHLADLSQANRFFWKIMLPETATAPKLNTVKLEVYMESQCPDTSRFLHKQLMKAWSLLSQTGRVELVLIPFGKARCTAKDNDFECFCQHQANECILNQLMNCVIDRVGFPDKIVPIIDCIQGKPNLESAMQSCIANNALLNPQE